MKIPQTSHSVRQTVILHRSLIQLLFEFLGLILPVSFIYIGLMFVIRPETLTAPPLASGLLWGYRSLVILSVLEVIRRYFNTIYILGPQRVTRICGRLALSIRRYSVAYVDVREVKVQQSLLGRIFDFGNVTLETASKEIPEMLLFWIASPREIASYVEKSRADVFRHLKQLSKASGQPKLSKAPDSDE